MANGYVGKISAVVTANTAPLGPGLDAGARKVDAFAKRIQGTISQASGAAGKSFEQIFTPLQRLGRALAAAPTLQLTKDVDIKKVLALVSAAEGIAKPLGGAAGQFGKLSAEVQAAFLPALIKAQSAVETLGQGIQSGASVGVKELRRLEGEVSRTVDAINRLTEASSLVGRLGRGVDLRNTAPQQFDAFSRAISLQGRSEKLSGATAVGFGLGGQQSAVTAQAKVVERLLAKREQLLSAKADTAKIDSAIARQTAELTKQLDVQERLVTSAEEYQALQKLRTEGGFVSSDSLEAKAKRLAPQEQQQAAVKADPLGPALGSAEQQLSSLRSSFVSLQGQIEKLPTPLKSDLIPALVKTRSLISSLGDSPADEELKRAAAAAKELEVAVSRASDAAKLRVSARQFIDSAAVKRASGELQALQQILVQVGSNGVDPVARAYNRLAAAAAKFTREGTLGSSSAQKVLARLKNEAAAAAAATGKINAGVALRQINRGGSISTSGAQNATLAIQQLAFAVDDFFSVTGTFDQRLRAIGNNLSQFGFLIGGTTGLIVGIAASLGAQAVTALLKYANAGTTAADRANALNEALQNQKSLAEEVANSIGSIASALGDIGVASGSRGTEKLLRQIDDVAKKQRELREARLVNLDPTVQRERAVQGSLRQQLESTDNTGQRVNIQQRIEQSAARERAAARAAANRQGPSPADIVKRIAEGITAIGEARAFDRAAFATGPGGGSAGAAAVIAREQAATARQRTAFEAASRPSDIRAARAIAEERLSQLVRERGNPSSVFSSGTTVALDREIASLGVTIEALKVNIEQVQFDSFVETSLRAATALANGLGRAQSDIEKSGLEFSTVSEATSAASQRIEEFAKALETADPGQQASLEKQRAEIDKLSKGWEYAAGAVSAFGQAITKVSDTLNNAVLSEFTDFTVQARRDSNLAKAEADTRRSRNGMPLNDQELQDLQDTFTATEQRRQQAEKSLRDAESNARQIRDENQRARSNFERDALLGRLGAEPATLAAERARLQQEMADSSVSADRRTAASARVREIDERLGRLFEDSVAGVDARVRADLADQEVQRQKIIFDENEQRRQSALRGRDLARTDAERAAAEVRPAAADLRNFFRDFQIPDQQQADALGRFLQDRAQQVAPQIMGFREERMNAILQGPSRAALSAVDINTAEGARELNRLIRGDDPARDVNLIELQKQSDLLQKIIDTIKAETNQIVEIRG